MIISTVVDEFFAVRKENAEIFFCPLVTLDGATPVQVKCFQCNSMLAMASQSIQRNLGDSCVAEEAQQSESTRKLVCDTLLDAQVCER